MAITVKHKFVSAIPDAGDPTIVQPSNWNDNHELTGLGTMAEQNANAVAITGGTISGVTIPASNLTGTVDVPHGGTGANTLTGYVKGTGTTAMTASSTIPNTDITGLGTASTKDAGVANGVATLDGSGTVPISQLPSAVLGALSYQGTWNASTNSPTLTSSVGTKGYYYVVSVAGSTNLNGITDWLVGDWAVYNGTAWQKVDNTDAVTSVNGYTGTVVLNYTDVGAFPATATTGTGNVVLATNPTISSPNIDVIDFDQAYATALTAGQLGWDGNNTLALGMAGGNVIQHIGEDSFFYIKASSAITKGQLVMFTGAVGASGVITGAPSTGITNPQYIIGIAAESIASNGFGLIQWFGEITGVNTNGFNEGDILYYDSAVTGGLTNVFPTSGPIITVAAVAKKSASGGVLVVRVVATQRISASTGISVSQNDVGVTVTNTAPDQTVAIASGTGISVTGTYPNFTVTNTSPSSGGTVTSVTGTAPVVSSGGTTPAISMPAATTSVSGYLTSTDWNTFNNKQPAGTYVTSVSGTTGRITSSGGTTPAIDLASGIATAGTTGSSTLIPVVTVDTYGRVTSVTTASNPQGTVTSVGGTGTVNGITLTGTVTSSGNLTLGGTLSGVSLTTQVSGTLPLANGGTNATTAPAAMTNLRGWTTTATAAGTTTLTNTSTFQQEFTGTTTQTVVMPVTSTLALGWSFEITNNSTGSLTIQSSGLNTIGTITAGTTASLVCTAITGTTAASWDFDIDGFASETGTGSVVRAASPTITGTLTASGNITTPVIAVSNGIVVNNRTIGATYAIPAGYSATSAGPITISSGVTVTVPTGGKWVVL